jgi:hypothetical protein
MKERISAAEVLQISKWLNKNKESMQRSTRAQRLAKMNAELKTSFTDSNLQTVEINDEELKDYFQKPGTQHYEGKPDRLALLAKVVADLMIELKGEAPEAVKLLAKKASSEEVAAAFQRQEQQKKKNG